VKEFAEYIDSHMVSNNDLILPESEKKLLQNIISYMTNYYKISDKSILFGSSGRRGMNAVCLFSGPSGTGKTMAAQVIANSLDLELFRLDLASVMSKWVGETEQNIRKLFDAAENGGVCLLIDECDTLLHKRSSGELHDSVERYGNNQISYMLQKIEEFHGLIILTSNMKDAIDSAFTRRILIHAQFHFPNTSERKQIWERHLSSLNIADIDLDLLSKLDIPGGNIQKIVLNAALLSAGRNSKIDMNCIKEAVKIEYAKLEKPLIEKELLLP
jgi:SpoVK/Ycf46/Vps4 family AAA+-type ATPase